jgi:hypothetical protein
MPAQAWVTLIIGLIAAGGVLITWHQKNRADRRAEWWRRVSWAFDHALSTDAAEAEFGWLMVDHLARSPLATKDDADLFQTVAERWITSDTEDDTTGGPDEFEDADPVDEDDGNGNTPTGSTPSSG